MDLRKSKDFENIPSNTSIWSKKWLFREVLALCTLVLSCAWFFRKSLIENHSFGIWQDNEFLISPLFHSISERNDWLGINTYLPEYLGGLDLEGFAQFSTLYPLYFLGGTLFENPLSSIQSLNLLVHLHLLIFAFGSYYLAKCLGCSRTVAILCALFVVFNSNTLNYASWINIIAPYSWLPWILAFLIKALEKNLYRYWFFFYISSTLMLLASPAQPVIHTIFFVTVISFVKFLAVRKNLPQKKLYYETLKKFSLGFPFFAAVLSPVLIPFISAASRQIRWIGNFPPVTGFSKIPFEGFLTAQVEKVEIPNLLIPPTVAREIGSVYFGFFILILLGYGLLKLRQNIYWKIFFVIGVYSLFSSFGNNFGFAQINYQIPLLNAIREPSRFLILSHFCFAICAALGMNEAILRLSKAIKGRELIGKFLSSGNLNLSISLPILLVFLVIQPTAIMWQSPSIANSDYLSESWADIEVPIEKVKELDPSGQFRVIFGGAINSQKASMFAAFHGLRTLNTYINPLPLRQFNAMYFYDSSNLMLKEFLGARFLICSTKCSSISSEGYGNYKLIWSNQKFEIYENDQARSFISLPNKYIMTNNFQKNIDVFNQNDQSAWILDENATKPRVIDSDCKLNDYTNRKFTIIKSSINCQSSGYLVISAFNDGNWAATVNGASRKVEVANGDLVGLKLLQGKNEIHLEHRTELRIASAKASAIFLVFYLLTIGLLHRKRLAKKFSREVASLRK